jgi:hypothetical protein
MLVEYDILSSAGNRSFAKAIGAVSGQLQIPRQKSSEKIQFQLQIKEGFKKWRKAK